MNDVLVYENVNFIVSLERMTALYFDVYGVQNDDNPFLNMNLL